MQSTGLTHLVKASQEELIKEFEAQYLKDYKNKMTALLAKLAVKREELMDADRIHFISIIC
ncbi:hypothetical protein WAX46_14220 [Bacillus sp. FJAT-53060]|uniref:hypothetical protein n=1 Tax=Bacillus TaxID=1386 RepID=UPI001CFA2031|nr:hypothetical protein [Bacillus stratosphericus]